MKREELTPIELECNMGTDVNGVVQREPWKAYDIDEVNILLDQYEQEIADLKSKLETNNCPELHAHKADVSIPVYGTISDADVYLKDKVDAVIAKKDAEIAAIKASYYAEMVDAGMRERRLRRALWLARAESCRRLDVDRYLRNHRNSWYNENCLTWNDACVAMEVKMCKAENKCLKKAEQYR